VVTIHAKDSHDDTQHQSRVDGEDGMLEEDDNDDGFESVAAQEMDETDFINGLRLFRPLEGTIQRLVCGIFCLKQYAISQFKKFTPFIHDGRECVILHAFLSLSVEIFDRELPVHVAQVVPILVTRLSLSLPCYLLQRCLS